MGWVLATRGLLRQTRSADTVILPSILSQVSLTVFPGDYFTVGGSLYWTIHIALQFWLRFQHGEISWTPWPSPLTIQVGTMHWPILSSENSWSVHQSRVRGMVAWSYGREDMSRTGMLIWRNAVLRPSPGAQNMRWDMSASKQKMVCQRASD